MPEAKDSDWDWREFVARNNNELVATWGNLANRVLAFCYKNWDGRVPEIDPAALRPADLSLLAAIEAGFQSVGKELDAVHLRAALGEAMRLATEVNKYLDTSAPWFAIKTDKDAAAKSVYTALKAIDSLKLLFAPFLPFTSQRLHTFLGYDTPLFGEQTVETVQDSLGEHTVLRYRAPGGGTPPQQPALSAIEGWTPSALQPGAALRQPGPLFKKLEESVAEEERARLRKK
jgi:methionyl-tRNA synthetase